MLLALLASSALATPYAGLEWRPLSRGDLVWTDQDRTSGLAVGELDGFVHPQLSAFGGAWLHGDHVALQGSLGLARMTSTTWVGDVYRQRVWGVLRPELDVRAAIGRRDAHRAAPWVMLGGYGDIPTARDVSNGYSDEEQQTADQDAYAERLRLGGWGLRLGAGVDWRVAHSLSIGGMYAFDAYWGVLRSSDTNNLSSWIAGDAALLLTFDWPRKQPAGEP